MSSTIAHAKSSSVAAGRSAISSRTRSLHRAGSFLQTSWTMVGFAVAPTAPCWIAYSSSSTAQESFQMSVAVAAVCCSGLSVRVSVGAVIGAFVSGLHQVVAELGRALEYLDGTAAAVDADPIAVVDALGSVLCPDDCRDAELAAQHGRMRGEAT